MASLEQMVDATPKTRDRYVDFLRAASILVVVFGHWLMTVIHADGGRFRGENALDTIDGMWVLTWVLQVMPVFFFVGGFSNYQTIISMRRRSGDYARYIHSRMTRLLRPTGILVAAWLLAIPLLDVVFGVSPDILHPAGQLVGVPLWFLGVYVVVVGLAPVMMRLHERFGVGVLIVLALGAVGGDLARLVFETSSVGYLNFAFVWLFAHQIGFFYADGTFDRWRLRAFAAMGALSLAALWLLTAFGPYSPSMVGMDDGRASNNSPPSVCIIALTLWLVALSMRLRPRITAWLEGRRTWGAVIAVNSQIMTIYLWHLTAMVIAIPVLYPSLMPQPEVGGPAWWLLRPLWIASLVGLLAPFVWLFGRFERPRPSAVPTPAGRPAFRAARGAMASVGVALTSIGLQGLAVAGFSSSEATSNFDLLLVGDNPLVNAGCLLAGARLLSAAARPARAPSTG